MATKWKDSALIINELKDKFSWVPSMVETKTKNVKKKIDDGSVVVIEKMKDVTEKAGKAIKEWKDYVVDKCKNLKTKLNNVQERTSKKVTNNEEKSLSELIDMNKQLIELTKKLIDKYDENTKLINELSKKLSSSKSKTKSEKK